MEPIFMTPFLSRKHSIMNYVGWCRAYANKGAKNHSLSLIHISEPTRPY